MANNTSNNPQSPEQSDPNLEHSSTSPNESSQMDTSHPLANTSGSRLRPEGKFLEAGNALKRRLPIQNLMFIYWFNI